MNLKTNKMKFLIISFVLCFSLSNFGQNSIEKNPGDFDEIKVYDLINVTLIKSETTNVVISGDNMNDVSIENNNGALKIKMDLDEKFDGNKTNVTLYYKDIDVIDVNEGAYVSSEDIFTKYKMELRSQEGGFIRVNLEVTEVEIKAVTGGEIETKGKATRQDVSINTGGIYKGQNLITESTYVSIKAAGNASINASQLVDAKIRAGGDIFIYGKPKQINESKVLGGQIKRMD